MLINSLTSYRFKKYKFVLQILKKTNLKLNLSQPHFCNIYWCFIILSFYLQLLFPYQWTNCMLDYLYIISCRMKYIFSLLKNVLPVQRAAARTLCIYLRYNRKQEQRYEVIQKLIERKSWCPLYHEEVNGILVNTKAAVYKTGRPPFLTIE